MKNRTLSHRYLNENANGEISPLRTDRLGRLIFDDGSWLSHDATGTPITGKYDPVEWLHAEMTAWRLGRDHRLARKRIDPAYRPCSRQYPNKICRSYLDGFFSVPNWPRRTTP